MKFHEYFTTLQMVCRVSRKMGTPAPTAEELQHTLQMSKSAMAPDQWTMAALHWDFDRLSLQSISTVLQGVPLAHRDALQAQPVNCTWDTHTDAAWPVVTADSVPGRT